ncbi:MAG: VWA domain-containing protein [Candidatus Obscuribacterales bacterium]|nr:VWA domain-containing protein [Candidatus Obscuribacterales bacterium]
MLLKHQKVRNQKGSMIAIGISLLTLLIPLAAFVYDLSMIRQQYNALKAATDSAALAAAAWLAESDNREGDTESQRAKAQKIALPYFRSNQLMTGTKYNGSLALTESANTDISKETLSKLGQSKLYLSLDANSGRVTVLSEFCIQPTLLSIFGLYTLHARSVAGPGKTGSAGDVCFVLDLSASMSYSTPRSRNVAHVHPRRKNELKEKRLKESPNLIRRFAVPAYLALTQGDPAELDAYPNTIVNHKGTNVRPFGAAGYVSFNNHQIPNPHNIDFIPSPNPTNYHPAGTVLKPIIKDSSAPGLKIDQSNTPLLYALLNDFASKDPNVPVTVNYPEWPSWPPVNPSQPFTYFDARGAAAPASSAELLAGQSYDGSDPSHMPYDESTPVRIKNFKTYTIPEMMTIVLLAAKRGYLESRTEFENAPPEFTFALRNYFQKLGSAEIPFSPGYQKEYNKLALTTVQALETQVSIVHDVVDNIQKGNPDAHWSLVGFNQHGPGLKDRHPPSNEQSASPGGNQLPYDWKTTRKNGKAMSAKFYQMPLVPLDSNRNNREDVLRLMDEATLRFGTNTPQGLAEGIEQLNGAGHRSGKSKTLILITDGRPTHAGSIKTVKPSRRNGHKGLGDIKLIIVGLFEGNYACPGGPRFCKRLQKAAGANALLYPMNKMTRNCGKLAGDPDIDLAADAKSISKFIQDSIGDGGSIGLIE